MCASSPLKLRFVANRGVVVYPMLGGWRVARFSRHVLLRIRSLIETTFRELRGRNFRTRKTFSRWGSEHRSDTLRQPIKGSFDRGLLMRRDEKQTLADKDLLDLLASLSKEHQWIHLEKLFLFDAQISFTKAQGES